MVGMGITKLGMGSVNHNNFAQDLALANLLVERRRFVHSNTIVEVASLSCS